MGLTTVNALEKSIDENLVYAYYREAPLFDENGEPVTETITNHRKDEGAYLDGDGKPVKEEDKVEYTDNLTFNKPTIDKIDPITNQVVVDSTGAAVQVDNPLKDYPYLDVDGNPVKEEDKVEYTDNPYHTADYLTPDGTPTNDKNEAQRPVMGIVEAVEIFEQKDRWVPLKQVHRLADGAVSSFTADADIENPSFIIEAVQNGTDDEATGHEQRENWATDVAKSMVLGIDGDAENKVTPQDFTNAANVLIDDHIQNEDGRNPLQRTMYEPVVRALASLAEEEEIKTALLESFEGDDAAKEEAFTAFKTELEEFGTEATERVALIKNEVNLDGASYSPQIGIKYSDEAREMQAFLKLNGYDVGKIDGFAGPKTIKAFEAFAADNDIDVPDNLHSLAGVQAALHEMHDAVLQHYTTNDPNHTKELAMIDQVTKAVSKNEDREMVKAAQVYLNVVHDAGLDVDGKAPKFLRDGKTISATRRAALNDLIDHKVEINNKLEEQREDNIELSDRRLIDLDADIIQLGNDLGLSETQDGLLHEITDYQQRIDAVDYNSIATLGFKTNLTTNKDRILNLEARYKNAIATIRDLEGSEDLAALEQAVEDVTNIRDEMQAVKDDAEEAFEQAKSGIQYDLEQNAPHELDALKLQGSADKYYVSQRGKFEVDGIRDAFIDVAGYMKDVLYKKNKTHELRKLFSDNDDLFSYEGGVPGEGVTFDPKAGDVAFFKGSEAVLISRIDEEGNLFYKAEVDGEVEELPINMDDLETIGDSSGLFKDFRQETPSV